jgi:DNA-binding NtrC family response regulator
MKKIIFVDDDENLLKSMERILHPFMKLHTITFTVSPGKVLDLLKNEEYDIVIADYKMPEMDGIELLKVIKEKYPKMRRILLTGQSDSEIFDKSKSIVHQYLAKPCSQDELLKIIND